MVPENITYKMLCSCYKSIVLSDPGYVSMNLLDFRSLLHNFIVRKAISEAEITKDSITKFYKSGIKLTLCNNDSIGNSISVFHDMQSNLECLFKAQTDPLELETIRSQLLDYSLYRTIITSKSDVSIYKADQNNLKYSNLKYNVVELINKVKTENYTFVSPTKFQGIEVVKIDDTKYSISFFFYFGITEEDKICAFIFSQILRTYVNELSETLKDSSAVVCSLKSYRNVSNLYFSDTSADFFETVQHVITGLYIMTTNQDILTSFLRQLYYKQLDYELSSALEILKLTKEEALTKFGIIEKLLRNVKTKCIYFGQEDDKFNELKRDILNLKFHFTDDENFALLPNNNKIQNLTSKSFRGEQIIFQNICCNNIQELLDVRIMFYSLLCCASFYFSMPVNYDYWNHFSNADTLDQKAIIFQITSMQSCRKIQTRARKFKRFYIRWINNVDMKTFIMLKTAIYHTIMKKKNLNLFNEVGFLAKWGYLVKYSDLRDKIREYFADKLTIEYFKRRVRESIETNFTFSFE